MELNIEVERTVRHRIIVTVSVPEVFLPKLVRERAEICAADIPDGIEWKAVTAPVYAVTAPIYKSVE